MRISISLGANPDAIVIPEQAIWPIGQNKTVYVVNDGTAEQRVVRIGERQPGFVEITDGLSAGEVIVTAGQMKLYDGATVRSVDDASSGSN